MFALLTRRSRTCLSHILSQDVGPPQSHLPLDSDEEYDCLAHLVRSFCFARLSLRPRFAFLGTCVNTHVHFPNLCMQNNYSQIDGSTFVLDDLREIKKEIDNKDMSPTGASAACMFTGDVAIALCDFLSSAFCGVNTFLFSQATKGRNLSCSIGVPLC